MDRAAVQEDQATRAWGWGVDRAGRSRRAAGEALSTSQPALLAPALLLTPAQTQPQPQFHAPHNTHPASLRRPLAVGVGFSLLTCRLHEHAAHRACNVCQGRAETTRHLRAPCGCQNSLPATCQQSSSAPACPRLCAIRRPACHLPRPASSPTPGLSPAPLPQRPPARLHQHAQADVAGQRFEGAGHPSIAVRGRRQGVHALALRDGAPAGGA